jgi:hypothetical protein
MKEFKYLKTFESFSGEELNEEWGKKTPEQLVEIGKKTIEKNSKTKMVFDKIVKDSANNVYPKDASEKYLMWIAQNGPGGIFGSGIQSFAATWDKNIKAPNETMGYWVERSKISGGTGGKNMGA